MYSSTGLKFFVSQKLVVGKPAGFNGYYRSIIYKNAAIVPSIWGQNKNYDYAIENHINVKRSREAVKQFLTLGKVLKITDIRLHKDSKPNFYLIAIASELDYFRCDLQFALSLKELAIL